MGHLSRLLAIANELKRDKILQPEFLIFGDSLEKADLKKYKVYDFAFDSNLPESIGKICSSRNPDIIFFDIFEKNLADDLSLLFKDLKKQKKTLISIDGLIKYSEFLDLVWIPSFYFDKKVAYKGISKIKYGWDYYLIQKRYSNKKWKPGKKVLVLTGASDVCKLGETLPSALDKKLKINNEITWVKGPFSSDPVIPNNSKSKWKVSERPENLDSLILQSNYVLTVYGVSFFEALQYGIPCVVFSPYGTKDEKELNEINKQNVAFVSNTAEDAVKGLFEIINNEEMAQKFSQNALNIMKHNGVKKLCEEVYCLIGK